MDLIRVTPRLHMLRFPIGQAYVWQDQGASRNSRNAGSLGNTDDSSNTAATSDGDELTLIDAGWPGSADDVANALHGVGLRPEHLRRVVLTHCHPDHVGSAGELAARYGCEVLAHRLDAPVIRGESLMPTAHLLDWERPLYEHAMSVPAAPATCVDRELEDGEELGFGAGARVVHTPGHTNGSVAVHLPRHGVLFTGDTVASVGQVALGVFHVDRAEAKASMRRLATLNPRTVCCGHGDPVTEDAATALRLAADRDAEDGDA